LREEHRLRVFENGVLRKVLELLGPKKDEVTESNEDLNDLYPHQIYPGDQKRKNVMGWVCGLVWGRVEVHTRF